MIGALVLAAGAGRRYGAYAKQLAELDGRPVLEHVLEVVALAPVDRRVVVLGAGAEAILAGVRLHGAEPVLCPGWEEGQAASLRAGVAALAEADALVVVLGDQPLLSPEALARVLDARGPPHLAAQASYGGRPGHPVVLERTLFPRLLELTGDVGARALLSAAAVQEVPCDGLGRPDDVDTPEQLEVLRT